MTLTRILEPNEQAMLLCLYHLRYLTPAQIHRLWYGHRVLSGCTMRLSRLSTSHVLHSQRVITTRETAVSLGSTGLRWLQQRGRVGQFQATNPLTQLYLPHHIATNEVFCALVAGPCPAWGALPFTWQGTLSSGLFFEERRRDPFGVWRTRRARLRPDAIVQTSGRRIFVELDRSTECLREADGRRSIRRKMHAYETFLRHRPPAGQQTFARATFGNDRPARVLFVVDRRDGQDRRLHGIRKAARDIAPQLDVHVVYLDEPAALRRLCCVEDAEGRQAEAPQTRAGSEPPASAGPAERELQALQHFYRLAVEELGKGSASTQPALRAAARAAKAALLRLGSTPQTTAHRETP